MSWSSYTKWLKCIIEFLRMLVIEMSMCTVWCDDQALMHVPVYQVTDIHPQKSNSLQGTLEQPINIRWLLEAEVRGDITIRQVQQRALKILQCGMYKNWNAEICTMKRCGAGNECSLRILQPCHWKWILNLFLCGWVIQHVLENVSLHFTLELLQDPDLNFLKHSGFSEHDQDRIRETIIRCVLATDMACHNTILHSFIQAVS